jgi:hypothetical protein
LRGADARPADARGAAAFAASFRAGAAFGAAGLLSAAAPFNEKSTLSS